MITGRLVNEPWPISAAGDTIVMVPSGAIFSQAFGAYGAKESGTSANASSMSDSASGAMVSAKVRPAAAPRKSRRFIVRFMAGAFTCLVMVQPSRAARWIALMILR